MSYKTILITRLIENVKNALFIRAGEPTIKVITLVFENICATLKSDCVYRLRG